MAIDVYSKKHMLAMDGGPVCVYEAGDESLPPVLLLHGAMYDEARFIWHHLAPALAATRHVLAVDFPRHGQSRPWVGKLGQDTLVEVVHEVIGHFSLPPLPLIGLSMGGSVAIGYALKYPEQVSGGVFMNPGGLGEKVTRQLSSWLFTKTPGALKALTKYYARLAPEKMRQSVVRMLETREESPDIDDLTAVLCEEARRKKQYDELPMDDWQLEALAPFRLKLNFLPELHRMKCPALWLRGVNDPLVGQAVMEEAARLTNGSLRIVENAGHVLPLEQPEAVFQIVSEFIEINKL